MSGKEKLYFLLDTIAETRTRTPSGQPLLIHPADDLNNNYREYELPQLFTKLEKDEGVLKVIRIPGEITEDNYYSFNNEAEDSCYHIQLLPAFDEYFLKIQQEPEYREFVGEKSSKQNPKLSLNLSALHPEIFSKCQSLLENAAYPEAVEKGFKVVRDRLRDLTGYEKGSEAFGKGKLHIKGAVAQNVDSDFNQGVMFLTMAIDMFRNEKSHTSNAKIDDPQKAYEYLTLSSLAMRLLDQAEIVAT